MTHTGNGETADLLALLSQNVLPRFLDYVKTDTQSDENSSSFPSTEKQKLLGRKLANELSSLGASDVFFDEEYCYVYASIPGNRPGPAGKTLCFISHMDTSPEVSGADVHPLLWSDYDGGELALSSDRKTVLSPLDFPELKNYKGKTLITTDGSTLLGADDKAGIAEIMTMAEYLLSHKDILHGRISICFTPDEEIGSGVDHIDMTRLAADYGYTVDGGAFGEIEYENFNAAAAKVTISGISVHPGDAKNKMINASLAAMEFNALLPSDMRPDSTEGYEGFYHLTEMSGSVEKAELSYIIRNHDMQKFIGMKEFLLSAVDRLNENYGKHICDITLRDQYYNMREKIEPDYLFLVETAKNAISCLGASPVVKPIRGGTDGASLSFMGLPCPNLCTGGHNYHGRFEYCCLESMASSAALLIKLAEML